MYGIHRCMQWSCANLLHILVTSKSIFIAQGCHTMTIYCSGLSYNDIHHESQLGLTRQTTACMVLPYLKYFSTHGCYSCDAIYLVCVFKTLNSSFILNYFWILSSLLIINYQIIWRYGQQIHLDLIISKQTSLRFEWFIIVMEI